MITELLIALFSYSTSLKFPNTVIILKQGRSEPKMDKEIIEKIVKFRLENMSFRAIAEKLKISEKPVMNNKNVTLQYLMVDRWI